MDALNLLWLDKTRNLATRALHPSTRIVTRRDNPGGRMEGAGWLRQRPRKHLQ